MMCTHVAYHKDECKDMAVCAQEKVSRSFLRVPFWVSAVSSITVSILLMGSQWVYVGHQGDKHKYDGG